jgi:hypothetical protein
MDDSFSLHNGMVWNFCSDVRELLSVRESLLLESRSRCAFVIPKALQFVLHIPPKRSQHFPPLSFCTALNVRNVSNVILLVFVF